mmetsp:Transcript_78228/g.243014  ORF Transcript_78228/g.243014 Transcript_78228/m.243014 type:complete len:236 (-) Transcript_78228:7-714(-)
MAPAAGGASTGASDREERSQRERRLSSAPASPAPALGTQPSGVGREDTDNDEALTVAEKAVVLGGVLVLREEKPAPAPGSRPSFEAAPNGISCPSTSKCRPVASRRATSAVSAAWSSASSCSCACAHLPSCGKASSGKGRTSAAASEAASQLSSRGPAGSRGATASRKAASSPAHASSAAAAAPAPWSPWSRSGRRRPSRPSSRSSSSPPRCGCWACRRWARPGGRRPLEARRPP